MDGGSKGMPSRVVSVRVGGVGKGERKFGK